MALVEEAVVLLQGCLYLLNQVELFTVIRMLLGIKWANVYLINKLNKFNQLVLVYLDNLLFLLWIIQT
jgi:hypothetical protein